MFGEIIRISKEKQSLFYEKFCDCIQHLDQYKFAWESNQFYECVLYVNYYLKYLHRHVVPDSILHEELAQLYALLNTS